MGNELKSIRLALGWSQRRMAAYAENIPIRTYQGWELGERIPPEYVPRMIIRLLIAEEILTGEEIEEIIEEDHS